MTTYDTLIIGGGPAGQSAAIYLQRFNRQVVLFDTAQSRTLTYEHNENYLGFPEGIASKSLYERGLAQATRFGALHQPVEVQRVVHHDGVFIAYTSNGTYTGRSIIIATGVTDLYPNLPNFEEYLGRSLFWCITCDGFKTVGKKVIVVGDTDEAACTALQFLQFTKEVVLVTNYSPDQSQLSKKWRERLWKRHVEVFESEIKSINGAAGQVSSLELDNQQQLAADFIFNMQGAIPNNSLATELGVQVNGDGYIEANDEQQTNVPFVFAAGDVTKRFSHQIVTAAHEGSMAAQACNYALFDEDQRI
ncbi:MAG: NAD(P)/FAD-dependent oxidoreductase [bacterium]|nr:NAD(P)/FAD-dependent oxidoreductase [bacterium]